MHHTHHSAMPLQATVCCCISGVTERAFSMAYEQIRRCKAVHSCLLSTRGTLTIQVCASDCELSPRCQQLSPCISWYAVAVIHVVHRPAVNAQQCWAAAILLHQVLQVSPH